MHIQYILFLLINSLFFLFYSDLLRNLLDASVDQWWLRMVPLKQYSSAKKAYAQNNIDRK